MFIIRNRKIWYSLSVILLVLSVGALTLWGLKPGIDFTGGSLMEIEYATSTPTPNVNQVTAALGSVGINGVQARPTGESGYIVRTPFLDQNQYTLAKGALQIGSSQITVKRFDSIGPAIGSELKTRSVWAIVLVLVVIALFIAFVFRHVSRPVSSWKYGLVALLALAHDVFIPVGVFAYLGHYYGVEVDTLFVTALLVVLGFSVHDTIVVFDRTRENLRKNAAANKTESFEEVVGRSVTQTLARSINTSLTTVLALVALYIWGPASSHYFTLALLIGIIAGTYSSIFIGSPLLVTLEKMQKPHTAEHKKK